MMASVVDRLVTHAAGHAMIYSSWLGGSPFAAASAVHKLVELSESMVADAALARQVNRRVVE